MENLTIEVKDKVPSINTIYSGMHWGKRKQIADEKHELVFYAVKQALRVRERVGRPVTLPFKKAKVAYEIYFKSKIRRDWDNLFLKLYNDGLVRAGVLIDDDSEHLELKSIDILKGYREDKLIIRLYEIKSDDE